MTKKIHVSEVKIGDTVYSKNGGTTKVARIEPFENLLLFHDDKGFHLPVDKNDFITIEVN